jgi:hypothetical protein
MDCKLLGLVPHHPDLILDWHVFVEGFEAFVASEAGLPKAVIETKLG